jgi:hypothetical protein
MMKRKIEKHMPYFDVIEALAKTAECALCMLESDSLKRYFDALLYEMVNDAKVRNELGQSKGYCHRHANMLLDCQSGYGTGILYQDQVAAFIECLRGLSSTGLRRFSAGTTRKWNAHPGCPACRIQMESRERGISVFLEGMAEPDMRDVFERSAGFCVSHFFIVVESAKSIDVRKYVTQVQQGKYAVLLEDLAEFDRKHDYRFSRETMGKEGDSWARAVRMIVGQRDLF